MGADPWHNLFQFYVVGKHQVTMSVPPGDGRLRAAITSFIGRGAVQPMASRQLREQLRSHMVARGHLPSRVGSIFALNTLGDATCFDTSSRRARAVA